MLTEIQKLALEKLSLEANRRSIAPGVYQIPAFNVQVSGTLDVLPDQTYTPTTDIPLIPIVALALKKMGVQRDHFLGVLREAATEVLLADKEMRAALIQQVGLADFEEEFRQRVLATLPRKTRAGQVKADLTVVETR
jgi:hypothetical protein